jgi:hypothetical protein
MTAQVITPFSVRANALDVARQEWLLARRHYREVCIRYDARLPESVEQFRAASERREAAFERYMQEMQDY